MAHYLARYYLSCGHTADVPATMDKLENPIVCPKCSAPTELPSEVLEVVRGTSIGINLQGTRKVH